MQLPKKKKKKKKKKTEFRPKIKINVTQKPNKYYINLYLVLLHYY